MESNSAAEITDAAYPTARGQPVTIAAVTDPLVVAAVTVVGTVGLGQWLASRWQAAGYARQQDLENAAELHALYGAFFSLWKEWRLSGYPTVETDAVVAEPLAIRAASSEGRMEALLVRFASERQLSTEDLHCLGALRQSYQALRKSILGSSRATARSKANVADWDSSRDPDYVAFKALAATVSAVVAEPRTKLFGLSVRRPTPREAKDSLLTITSNDYEALWPQIGAKLAQATEPYPPRFDDLKTPRV